MKRAEEVGDRGGVPARRIEAVLIGISTGGPPALQSLVCRLPASYNVPILVAQHMPAGFTASLSERLNRLSPLEVREARDGDPLNPGTVLIAPAGWHVTLERRGRSAVARLLEASKSSSWYRPCIDILYTSAAQFMASRTLALVMTGLGDDGTAGAKALKAAGATIWAQDEATSAVYGMPRSVFEAGVVDRVLALGDIPPALCSLMAADSCK